MDDTCNHKRLRRRRDPVLLSQRIGRTGHESDIRTEPINTQFTDNAYAGRSSLLLGKKQTLLAQNVIGSTSRLEVTTMGVKIFFNNEYIAVFRSLLLSSRVTAAYV